MRLIRRLDIFGRRWFFIVGSALALVGSIVCAVAPNIPALIAGMTLIGLASSAQLSFAFASTELVPIKYRFLSNGFCYAWLVIPNGFGAIISTSFIYESSAGWRGTFYLMTGLNAACTACVSMQDFKIHSLLTMPSGISFTILLHSP
jgi:MFS family permease